jgi:hypothetical protein
MPEKMNKQLAEAVAALLVRVPQPSKTKPSDSSWIESNRAKTDPCGLYQ